MRKYFITATDTDAGKTFVATALVKALVNQAKTVAVYKPISAGCNIINGQLVNEDALLLQKAANCDQSIASINPIAFKEPIAPHIAAFNAQKTLSVKALQYNYEKLIALNPDIIITEGAGGWRLPLGNGAFLSDFATATTQQVILVVNMKLGCLNHAILTLESILADGLECIGWVANAYQDMDYLEENITELVTLLNIPMLAKLTREKDIEHAAVKFDLTLLSCCGVVRL